MPKKSMKSTNRNRNHRTTKNTHKKGKEPGTGGRRGAIIAVASAAVLVLGGTATLGAVLAQDGQESSAASLDGSVTSSAPAAQPGATPASTSGASPSVAPAAMDQSADPKASSASGLAVPPSAATAPASSAAPAKEDPLKVGLARSQPTSLSIPAIKVDAKFAELGMAKDKTIQLPKSAMIPGWYSRSPSPGEIGPSIVAGFIRTPKGDGVFADLGKLKKGDKITVNRADGKAAVFQVDKIKLYPEGKFVASEVYSSPREPLLRIVTVGGTMKPTDKPGNVVVFAHLADVEKVTHDHTTGHSATASSSKTVGSR